LIRANVDSLLDDRSLLLAVVSSFVVGGSSLPAVVSLLLGDRSPLAAVVASFLVDRLSVSHPRRTSVG
jgi:hypothetical protein